MRRQPRRAAARTARAARRRRERAFRRALRLAARLTSSGLAAVMAACGITAAPVAPRRYPGLGRPGTIIGYRKDGRPIRLIAGAQGPALVQSKDGTTTSLTSLTVTLSDDTTAGNALIVCIKTVASTTSPTVSGITLGGSAGNFGQSVTEGSVTEDVYSAWQWAATDIAGGEDSVVITCTGGSGTGGISAWVMEVSGLATESFDKTSGNLDDSTSSTFTSDATATTSQASEFAVGMVCCSTSTTPTGPSSPWTNLANETGMIAGYQVLTSETTVTYSGSFSPSSAYVACVATYKAATSTAGTASLGIAASVTAAATETIQGAAALSAAASVTAAAVQTLQESASLGAGAGLSAAGTFTVPGAAALTVTASLSATVEIPGPAGAWSGYYSRDPLAYAPGPPALAPTAIPVANTAGNWLFAIVSWRQDAGVAGTLQYPSTVTVSDDAANFWIPVYSGIAATAMTSSPSTGIVRCAAWMAPAARPAQWVFASPTAYQSAVTAYVFEYEGACPWYEIQVTAASFANQGTSVSLSATVPDGVFAAGVLAWDDLATVTTTASGWTALGTLSCSNGTDHSGDLKQASWIAQGSGGSLTLSASSSTHMDFAALIVAVSGVSDTRAFPYSLPLAGWPVLVTEIAAGGVLNSDPVFADGAEYWTGTGADVQAAGWPLFRPVPQPVQPGLYGSLQIAPSGTASLSYAASDAQPVSTVTGYQALAWAYSAPGYGSATAGTGLLAGIAWYDADGSLISVTTGPAVQALPGEWTQLTCGPVIPPASAVTGAAVTGETAGTAPVPAAAVLYAGYCALAPAQAWEAVPPDQVTWADVSARNFTQGDIQVSPGSIQYESQSLEAGTMTVYLASQDAAWAYGNVTSPYWPAAGDTDIPVRLRAIWPGTLTPYSVLFSGFTDVIRYGWDTEDGTWYAYAEVQASDAWSRLTQQMLAVTENEALTDNPVAFISCDQTGASSVTSGPYAVPAQQVFACAGQVPVTGTPATASFTGGAISVTGAAGLSCWQSAGTQAGDPDGLGRIGWCLAWLPPVPLNVADGVTLEFWFSPVSYWSDQSFTAVTVCQALYGEFNPMWALTLNNTTPSEDSFQSFLQLSTWDAAGSLNGTSSVGDLISFYGTQDAAAASYYIVVAFDQGTVTVTVNPGDSQVTETLTVTGQDLAAECTGFTWGGGFTFLYTANPGFGDIAVADIAVYGYLMPPARSASRYIAGLTAFGSDSDCWRLARIAGYAGFTPVLGMRGTDLPEPPAADVDLVTGATDTNTQVVSAYFTNIASSTLAAMLVNGTGTLIYRRRQEWYDRAIAQYVTGEDDPQSLSLGINPLSAGFTTAGWATGNGAALTSSAAGTGGGALFTQPCAGLFAGNGSGSGPYIATTSDPPVTPGESYQVTAWLYCPQGWADGLTAQIWFCDGSDVLLETVTSPVVSLAAGSLGWASAGPARAPAGAAYLAAVIQAAGTPPGTTGFYAAAVQAFQVAPAYAGGAACLVSEAPYLPSARLSSDRDQLYNYAVLTQYGTNLISSFSGSSVLFTPSSGVVVTVVNSASAALRGQVPYTATVYLDNTAQAAPYYLNEGSIEDLGAWITQTLGSPLFRPGSLSLTPAATPPALVTALQAAAGDTVTFRRRAMGAPETEIVTFLSRVSHAISTRGGKWTVQAQLSPFPGSAVLACDDVVHGVLGGSSLLGF